MRQAVDVELYVERESTTHSRKSVSALICTAMNPDAQIMKSLRSRR